MTQQTQSPSKASDKPWLRPALVLLAIAYIVYILTNMAETSDYLHWPKRVLFIVAAGWLLYVLAAKLRSTRITGKKVVFTLILGGFLYACLFLMCFVFVKLMAAKDERLAETRTESLTEKARNRISKMLEDDHPAVYDREIGWIHRPGHQWNIHFTNEQGMRGKRTYSETPADPEKRILCIGDSFTYGYEVEDDETYPHYGEKLLPGTEWVNLGVCGTGLTQSYERYKRDGRKFGGKHVVIGFMSNNVKRTVNSFRAFISPEDIMPFTQPHSQLVNGELVVKSNPFQKAGDYRKLLENEKEELRNLYELDYFHWSNQRPSRNPILRTLSYIGDRCSFERNLAVLLNREDEGHGTFRPGDDPYGSAIWHPESPALWTNKLLFERYYKEVVDDGRVPLIVLLPSAGDVEDRKNGEPLKYELLLDYFEKKGLRYFCFLDTLTEKYGDDINVEDLYVRTHFNAETNKLLAESIASEFSLK